MESGIHSGLEIARSAIVLRGIRLPVVVDYRSRAAQVGYGSATLHERARLAGVVLIPTVERDHGVHDHKGPRSHPHRGTRSWSPRSQGAAARTISPTRLPEGHPAVAAPPGAIHPSTAATARQGCRGVRTVPR